MNWKRAARMGGYVYAKALLRLKFPCSVSHLSKGACSYCILALISTHPYLNENLSRPPLAMESEAMQIRFYPTLQVTIEGVTRPPISRPSRCL